MGSLQRLGALNRQRPAFTKKGLMYMSAKINGQSVCALQWPTLQTQQKRVLLVCTAFKEVNWLAKSKTRQLRSRLLSTGNVVLKVVLATLTVVLLALISPAARRNHSSKSPSMALSLYIQQPQIASSDMQSSVAQISGAGAFVFHHTLTEGPEKTSRSVGKAQGFIVPIEQFAHSAFNIIYLTFDTPHYSGSLSVQANDVAHKENEELTVVGGTGSFAFARGHAIFSNTQRQTYHVNLRLKFPNRSHSIPG
ncbi:Dirigent protein [Citrus sinensis]|uniref:Dirigent protein n=1 Tax=Citrus sinensis TaxID=2711 RepID=A0ACB8KVR0_CITSI|nr:Dirigent protein [Citrus sinensis]